KTAACGAPATKATTAAPTTITTPPLTNKHQIKTLPASGVLINKMPHDIMQENILLYLNRDKCTVMKQMILLVLTFCLATGGSYAHEGSYHRRHERHNSYNHKGHYRRHPHNF